MALALYTPYPLNFSTPHHSSLFRPAVTNNILPFSEVEAKEVSKFAGVYSVRSGEYIIIVPVLTSCIIFV